MPIHFVVDLVVHEAHIADGLGELDPQRVRRAGEVVGQEATDQVVRDSRGEVGGVGEGQRGELRRDRGEVREEVGTEVDDRVRAGEPGASGDDPVRPGLIERGQESSEHEEVGATEHGEEWEQGRGSWRFLRLP